MFKINKIIILETLPQLKSLYIQEYPSKFQMNNTTTTKALIFNPDLRLQNQTMLEVKIMWLETFIRHVK